MKKYFKKSWVIAIIAIITLLGVGGGAYAAGAFASSNLTTTVGTINIVATTTPDFAYTLSSYQVNFGTTDLTDNYHFNITSAPITVTKTGNQNITGLTLTESGWPTGISTMSFTLNPTINPDGSGGTFTITLDGTANSTPGTINLSNMVFTLTPY